MFAQTLSTEALSVTAVCPGGQLDVTGFRSSATGDFSVELSSDGVTYIPVSSTLLSASGRYEVTYRATIPADILPGTAYRVRVTTQTPALTGSPSPTLLTIKPKPVVPSVALSSLTLCQAQTAPTLSASATDASATLVWYGPNATGGTGSASASIPATTNVGTTSYYVAQVLNGCESDRMAIAVTVQPVPDAPTVTSLTVCQNAPAPLWVVSGQNLTWYTSATATTGTSVTPVISTSSAGTITYYVSQSVGSCVSPVASVSITVNALPAAPTVAAKTVCQFSTPESVSAVGQGLIWYSANGQALASAPVMATDKSGSFTALVTQTVGGCESPTAALVVSVVSTTAPVVGQTRLVICQGTVAQSLTAVGASLKWTLPDGSTSTTAPTPPTQTTSTSGSVNVYYVTQTLNGCESPATAVTVVVQATPTLTVLGGNTVNLGQDAPLELAFTGTGPFQYTLTNGVSGTAATSDTIIRVLPTQTTTYAVVRVTNTCGTGKPGSSSAITITVVSPTIFTAALTSTTQCAGSSLTANFLTTGTFTAGSTFKLQLAKLEADTSKITFVDALGAQASNGQIVGTIPGNTVAGNYWVRVVATNPKVPVNGTVSPTVLTVRPLPAATLLGNQTIVVGQPASLSVVFSGDSPWTFTYRDSSAAGIGTGVTVSTGANPHTLQVKPQQTTAYVLTSVSNNCGTGSLTARTVVVKVNPVLGIDDPSLAGQVDVYPIPATSTLTVTIKGASITGPATLQISDVAGRMVGQQETHQETAQLPLDAYAPGTYILLIRLGDRTTARRIVKH